MLFYSIRRLSLIFLSTTLILASCLKKSEQHTEPINEVKIVPAPYKLLYKRGVFELTKTTRILLNLSNNSEKEIANQLLATIKETTGYKLKIADRFTTSKINSRIKIAFNSELGQEEYRIYVTNSSLKLSFKNMRSAKYGIETLRQLLSKKDKKWIIPQLSLEDKPFISYRGIYLSKKLAVDNKIIEEIGRHRFNYIVVPNDRTIDSLNVEGEVVQEAEFDSTKVTKIISHLVPSTFYTQKLDTQEKVVFKINNPSLLAKDSLSILEEALWTRPENKDLGKLKECLTESKQQTH